MRIIITEHAKKRLRDLRQGGIALNDIQSAAAELPGHIPSATRFKGFISRSGRVYDLVVKDTEGGRLVITVIGKQ